MPEAAAKHKIGAIEVPESVIRRAAQARQATSTTTTVTPVPADNAIFKILSAEGATPEAKRAELTKYLTFTGTKEESKARVKAYQEFEEYLQTERKRMSLEIIKLTDTETFSELQSCYNDLNNLLIEYDGKMLPLTEILEAVYKLRMADKTMDAFAEIQSDRKAEAARKEDEAKKEAEFNNIQSRIVALNTSITTLGQERSFFGFGGVKEDARKQIALNEKAVNDATEQLGRLQADIAALAETPVSTSNMGDLTAEKGKLRELLDISSDVHKQRQRELVDAALTYVNQATIRIGSVRDHLSKMSNQIDALYDSNTKMTGVYAVMTEGVKDAVTASNVIRTPLQTAGADESVIAKMTREEKLAAVEDHIRELDTAAGSTIETFTDLTTQTIRIRTMKGLNESEIDKAKRAHNQGVAGVADRLSVTLQAVSAAALGEASAMTKETLQGMADRTNAVAQKQVIQLALGSQEINRDLEKALADLGDYGEVLRTSTGIVRESVTEAHKNLDRIRELADTVRGDIKESIGVHADATEADPGTRGANAPLPNGKDNRSPFG